MASDDRHPLDLGSVLVIGGCGFLGHHIVRQLLEVYTCTVSVLDLRTTNNRFPNVSYHNGDITSPDSLRPIFTQVQPTVVIHTASPAFTSDNKTLHTGRARALFDHVNIDGTRNLLDISSSIGTVKAFIYTSSSSVIHDTVSPLTNANESYPVLTFPQQPEYYASTKAVAESLVLSHNRHPSSPHLLTTAIRPAGIFGEGDTQLIPGLFKALRRKQTKYQLGDNNNLFDFTYVGNAAHAHILAAIALVSASQQQQQQQEKESQPDDPEQRADGHPFLITNAQPVYFWDFARAVWAAAGDPVSLSAPASLTRINEPLGLFIAGLLEWILWVVFFGTKVPSMTRGVVKYGCMTRYFDTGRARRVLGYRPVWGLDEGVRRTVEWFLREGEGEGGMVGGKGDGVVEGVAVNGAVVGLGKKS
ncbi:MAG: hypothetical protein LQ338_006978 [Usnochroma carphineum]|nr:MAG: hypothetical protein LQ338_006978 [Usnochroma carphineum]